jgi:hypothetical protein
MTESEEVNWYNSLGFNVTLSDLQASYAGFAPAQNKSTSTNVEWDTEADDLRDYYRLYKRTGNAGFLQQAQYEHDWQVNVYSQIGNSSIPTTATANMTHFYMMGLIDWYVDHKDQATLDAINRLLNFALANLPASFIETRGVARPLQCLVYYREQIGLVDVSAGITKLLNDIKTAPVYNGFISWPKYYVNGPGKLDNQPAGSDLRVLFPKNASFTNAAGSLLITGATTYDFRGFPGAASFQDFMLMHALNLSGRVLNDSSLTNLSLRQANAWMQCTGYPWPDPTGAKSNYVISYSIVSNSPDLTMWTDSAGSSTPLYVGQYAAFCPVATMRRALQQQACLRAYGEYAKIVPSEFGGRPRYWLWQTWQQGYFNTQK